MLIAFEVANNLSSAVLMCNKNIIVNLFAHLNTNLIKTFKTHWVASSIVPLKFCRMSVLPVGQTLTNGSFKPKV